MNRMIGWVSGVFQKVKKQLQNKKNRRLVLLGLILISVVSIGAVILQLRGKTFDIRNKAGFVSYRTNKVIATTSYLWYPAPNLSNEMILNHPGYWVYDPVATDGTLDQSYWERNLSDLAEANFNTTFMVTWAKIKTENGKFDKANTVYKDDNSHAAVRVAVKAATSKNIPIKFASFVDAPVELAGQSLDTLLYYNYERDIKKLYRDIIPKDRWATHNNQPVSAGGRPIIMMWTVENTADVISTSIQQLKDAFARDFGVTPFIIVEGESYAKMANKNVVDSMYQWNTPVGGATTTGKSNYRIGNIGIGDNESIIRPWRCNASEPSDPVINYRARGDATDAAKFVKDQFAKIPSDVSMLFFQDSNEMPEGTTILRMKNFPARNNPALTYCVSPAYHAKTNPISFNQRLADYDKIDNKSYLPPTYYIKTVGELIARKFPALANESNPVPATMVKSTCNKDGTVTLTWDKVLNETTGSLSTYALRMYSNNQRARFVPEDTGSLKTNTLTFKPNAGSISGFIQVVTTNGRWSESVSFPTCSTGSSAPVPTISPKPTTIVNGAQQPIGSMDTIDGNGVISGWAADKDVPSQSIMVHFYIDAPVGQGTYIGGTTANISRPDVNTAVGITGNHGYRWTLPTQYRNGTPRKIHVYAIDDSGKSANPQLSYSPRYYSVASNQVRSVGSGTNRATASDYNGDGKSDLTVWRASENKWWVKGISSPVWGTVGDIPVPGDYNGDGKTDYAVWRPSDGKWYIKDIAIVQWGTAGDIPVPGDYNGDGKTDYAVWRPSEGKWYVYGQSTTVWGVNGDFPVAGDYNGDGKTDLAVWRPGDGKWYIKDVSQNAWGVAGDIPVQGDYNGDGKTDLAVYRPWENMWYVMGVGNTRYGAAGDMPIAGNDLNGDRKADYLVFRPSKGTWHSPVIADTAWGTKGDVPISGKATVY
jgi:FG-GAP repeat